MLKAINVLPSSRIQRVIARCLSDIVKEVERLTFLTIGDKTFEVEYYLEGGDPLHGALTTEENIHIDQS